MAKNLPVFEILDHSFQLTIKNLGAAFRFSWAWILAGVGLLGLTALAGVSKGGLSVQGGLMLFSPFFLLIFLAAVSIAVVWHRYILLDEGSAMAFNLRADGAVWRYLGNVILIFLAAVVALIPFGMVSALFSAKIITQIGAAFVMPLVYRMSIKLPAIALGETGFTFKDALDYSSGNYWRFLGLSVIIMILSVLIELADKMLLGIGSVLGAPGTIVASILAIIPQLIFAIFNISILTTLYGYFIEDRKLG